MEEQFTDFLKNILKPIIKECYKEVQEEETTSKVEDRTFTRQQLCDRWSITLPTLNNYMRAGKVTPIHIGRRCIFSETEVLRAEEAGVSKYRHQ